jgi:ATP-dependent DNA helicase RecQ
MCAGLFIIYLKNIEGLLPEIGRAGRDGLPSETILFESYGDLIQLQKFASTRLKYRCATR